MFRVSSPDLLAKMRSSFKRLSKTWNALKTFWQRWFVSWTQESKYEMNVVALEAGLWGQSRRHLALLTAWVNRAMIINCN